MKDLLEILIIGCFLFSCEKETNINPETTTSPICKECTTIELTTGDEPVVTVVFACDEEAICKREKLNYYEVNPVTHKTTIWMTTCIKKEPKN